MKKGDTVYRWISLSERPQRGYGTPIMCTVESVAADGRRVMILEQDGSIRWINAQYLSDESHTEKILTERMKAAIK